MITRPDTDTTSQGSSELLATRTHPSARAFPVVRNMLRAGYTPQALPRNTDASPQALGFCNGWMSLSKPDKAFQLI